MYLQAPIDGSYNYKTEFICCPGRFYFKCLGRKSCTRGAKERRLNNKKIKSVFLKKIKGNVYVPLYTGQAYSEACCKMKIFRVVTRKAILPHMPHLKTVFCVGGGVFSNGGSVGYGHMEVFCE